MPISRGGSSKQLLVRIAMGCAFGALTAAVNHGFGPGSEYTSKVLGRDWCWLAAGLLSGIAASQWLSATRLVISFLIPAVWAYYLVDMRAGVYAESGARLDVLGAVSDIIAFSVIGSLSAVLLGFLVVLLRRGGTVGLIAGAAPFAFTARMSWGVYQHTPQDPLAEQVGWVTMWVALLGMLIWTVWRLQAMWRSRSYRFSTSLLHEELTAEIPNEEAPGGCSQRWSTATEHLNCRRSSGASVGARRTRE